MHAVHLVVMHLQCEVDLCHLLGGAEEKPHKPKSSYPVSRPGFESRIPWYEAGVLTAWQWCQVTSLQFRGLSVCGRKQF